MHNDANVAENKSGGRMEWISELSRSMQKVIHEREKKDNILESKSMKGKL